MKRRRTSPTLKSKILKTGDGFIQGYYAQIAVDSEHQIIVAHDLVAHGNDQLNFGPMIDKILAETGQAPRHILASGPSQAGAEHLRI